MQSSTILKKNWPNILILGQGYIGKALYNHLRETQNVILVSRKDLDYGSIRDLNVFCLNNQIDTIINCAGFTGRPNVDEAESRKEECLELNVKIPLKIARYCTDRVIRYIHMSSGCIYTGYEKEFTEKDPPNFGMYDHSSYYSKTKHLFEILTEDLCAYIFRLRMPICDNYQNPRNYISKILKYPNLIDLRNSKTYIPDLCEFTRKFVEGNTTYDKIFNVTNPEPLTTKEVLTKLGVNIEDKNWVKLEELDIVAPRSNCILDSSRAMQIHQFRKESEIYVKL